MWARFKVRVSVIFWEECTDNMKDNCDNKETFKHFNLPVNNR